jgi:hypothetical protein
VPSLSFTTLRSSRRKGIQSTCGSESSSLIKTGSKEARDEIQAYVAIRDLLLSDAEVTTTADSLRRTTIANEFVESCLRPPRSPYEAQSLEQRQAARELERCCAAKIRIAALRQKLCPGIQSN